MGTFPNVQFILLVGVGDGVPSATHDIRCGDVVVGSPYNGHDGGIRRFNLWSIHSRHPTTAEYPIRPRVACDGWGSYRYEFQTWKRVRYTATPLHARCSDFSLALLLPE
jgi:hypothetical protein